ncbi:hypothetical protein GQ57_38480 [Burkholderia sp. MSh2]|nr:hypothetical protein GQ57_38480 [Burkholderia sp. MSh2]
MVQQIWGVLGQDATEDEIQDAFDTGMPKIQLLLVWANARAEVPALPGSTRRWPAEGTSANLTFREMPTPSATYPSDSDSEDIDDEPTGSDGTTFLGPDEYAPSITNGLRLIERWSGYNNVFELTEAGETLANAFKEMVAGQDPQQVEWLRNLDAITIDADGVDALWKILRLDKPTAAERKAFAAQFFPEKPAFALESNFRHRRDGLTLALRALAAEESASGMPGTYIPVGQIRHTMARGFATDGTPLDLTDLAETQRAWQSLQIRKYLKVALEILFRSCEVRTHHAMVKSFARDENGKRIAVPRTIDAIARTVGELAEEHLTFQVGTVGDLLDAFKAAQGTASSLYLAGLQQSVLDLQENMRLMVSKSHFPLSASKDSSEGDAVASALCALLWCAVETPNLPVASREESGDRLTLPVLQDLVERFKHSRPAEFVAEVASNHVLNLHLTVVGERCIEDFEANRPVKDRYRILAGDEGLERNQLGGARLSTAEEMRDILLHALFLLAQAGFVTQHPSQPQSFRITAVGRRRAATDLAALDASAGEDRSAPTHN